ncbi:MAG: radical SAM protein [Dorea sp.]|nr:radical SAM protein [Dorea sp.]
MNIEQYYIDAQSGNKLANQDILSYIRSFPYIVIWGASYLGQEVAKYLIKVGITDFKWWDMRADEIIQIGDIPITTPFPNIVKSEKENSLVILCIGNTAIMPNLLHRLEQNEYTHILRGDKLYMGMLCPFDVNTGINGLVCNGTMTCRSMFCARLHNIVKEKYNNGGLFLENLTFMITTHCSLKCKYCCAYMNSYPVEKRNHFPYEQIASDIDRIFSVVDAVGSVTIQGGEPFLHPDIDRIVAKLLEKKNLGIISIATNGIFKIETSKLKCFCDSRLNVAFSGYYDALPQKTLDIYYKNIEFLKKSHIPLTIGVKMPEWQIPPTLWNRHYSEEVMCAKKDSCKIPERCMQVMNGKLYPCLYSVSLHGIGVADYPEDYVDLSDDNLVASIKHLMDRPFYSSCGHCGGSGGSTGMAGEQGFYDFINKEEN